jgi:hypothetical protein
VQDVINISTDGAFVAVAVGYSFIPARLEKPIVEIFSGNEISINNNQINGDTFPLNVLLAMVLPRAGEQRPHAREILVAHLTQCLLAKTCGIDFKYSIIDSGSGRELQNQPIHNIAGLGEPAGERPFRPLAKPMIFMPRSTIRIEVEEVSEGPIYGYVDQSGRTVNSELFIVFHGYKMLGYGTGLP